MRKNTLLTAAAVLVGLLLIGAAPALASTVYFSATGDVGGYDATGSATLTWWASGANEITFVVDNTSPLTDSGGNSNSPAIVGFGFDTEYDVSYTTLAVTAKGFISGAGSGADTDISTYWQVFVDKNLTGGNGGLTFDFVAHTDNGVQYGVINPNADGFTGSNLYETTATYVMTFSGDPGDLSGFYIRLQNLGLDGKGSLKAPETYVPIPGAVWLLGSGLIGLVGLRRKMS